MIRLLDCIYDRSVNRARTCPASVTPPVAARHSTQTLRNAMESLDTGGNPGQQVRRHLKKNLEMAPWCFALI